MPYARINEVNYQYEVRGSGEPLVLLHGFTGSLENWASHVETLAGHYLTITIDLLGHGRTDSPPESTRYRMKNCVDDVARIVAMVLDEYTTIRVHLLGYSMGGRLALYLALTRPSLIKSLILESASPGLETVVARQERVGRDERLARAIERDGVEAFVSWWEQIPLFASQDGLSPEARTRLREQRLRNNAMGLAGSLRGMGTGAQPSLWPRLAEIDFPLLLLAGALDPKFVALSEQMAALAPNARFEIVSHAGHTVHLERPEAFQELILNFLKNQETPH